MLKNLRQTFILLNMLTVAIVVIGAFSVIGALTYQSNMNSIYSALHLAIEEGAQVTRDAAHMLDSGDFTTPEIGKTAKNSIPVAVYAELTPGTYTHVSAASSGTLSGADYLEAFLKIPDEPKAQGVLGGEGLIFAKENVGGVSYYAFASTANIAGWNSMVVLLCVIAIITLLVFFVISLFFSKWALQPVETAWTKQHQFLADASHELKTPLTVILANTDIMLDHEKDTIENQKQWLISTQKEAHNMHELVVSMLDLAKMEAQSESTVAPEAAVHFERVDFSDVVFSAALQFESRAFEESVQIEEDIAEDVYVLGSEQPLERLCGTLLDNACKYADAGSNVDVKLEKLESAALKNLTHTSYAGNMPRGVCAVLSVHNAGPAIGDEDLAHVFDRFYRSDKARTHSDANNSYGLGLAIAANAVISHKGCIMATSVQDQGTTFRVVLPLG